MPIRKLGNYSSSSSVRCLQAEILLPVFSTILSFSPQEVESCKEGLKKIQQVRRNSDFGISDVPGEMEGCFITEICRIFQDPVPGVLH